MKLRVLPVGLVMLLAGFPPIAASAATAGGPRGVIEINFDDGPAPCVAGDTSALRDAYAPLGVLFRGPAPRDGGGIFDQCSNFGVSGCSPPNFLGFAGATYEDGGVALGPEFIRFSVPVSHVQINAAHGLATSGRLQLQAFSSSGALLDSDTIDTTSVLQTVQVNHVGIVYLRIRSEAGAFVVDDLVAG